MNEAIDNSELINAYFKIIDKAVQFAGNNGTPSQRNKFSRRHFTLSVHQDCRWRGVRNGEIKADADKM